MNLVSLRRRGDSECHRSGSAILMNLIALAIVLRVDIENRALMRGGRA